MFKRLQQEAPKSEPAETDTLASLDAACSKASAEIHSIRTRITEEQSALQSAQSSYSDLCRRLAAGEAVDFQSLRAAIADHEARLHGLNMALAEKEGPLAELGEQRARAMNEARTADERKRLAVLEEQALEEYRNWQKAQDAAAEAFQRVLIIADTLAVQRVSSQNETAFRQAAGRLRGWFSGIRGTEPRN